MKQLQRKILKYISDNRLFLPGDRVLIALSGGVDSMALLDILAGFTDLRLQLVVAHMNHLLRGDESDGDEKHAAAVALHYNLPFVSASVDVNALSDELGLSLEEAGREARYSFLQKAAKQQGCRLIALGHHVNDQVETFFIRLLRGAGGSGLAAMRPLSADSGLVRPLLCASRKELEHYLRQKDISWREDASNEDTSFLRNRIRHELIPYLERFNPSLNATISQTAEVVGVDEELLDSLSSTAFQRHFAVEGTRVTAAVSSLLAEPRALRLRLIRKGIAAAKGDLRRISYRHIVDIEHLLSSARPGAALSLPCGVRVQRVYGKVFFASEAVMPVPADFQLEISEEGVYELPCGGTLQVERSSVLVADNSTGVLILDAAAVSLPLLLRYFRDGDRFVPLGMVGSKKLKDLFIDRKIPLEQRRRTPLLLHKGDILWVCGVQLSAMVAGFSRSEGEQSFVISFSPGSKRL